MSIRNVLSVPVFQCAHSCLCQGRTRKISTVTFSSLRSVWHMRCEHGHIFFDKNKYQSVLFQTQTMDDLRYKIHSKSEYGRCFSTATLSLYDSHPLLQDSKSNWNIMKCRSLKILIFFCQAFSETHKKRLASWNQQVLKLLRLVPRKAMLDMPVYRQKG